MNQSADEVKEKLIECLGEEFGGDLYVVIPT